MSCEEYEKYRSILIIVLGFIIGILWNRRNKNEP